MSTWQIYVAKKNCNFRINPDQPAPCVVRWIKLLTQLIEDEICEATLENTLTLGYESL